MEDHSIKLLLMLRHKPLAMHANLRAHDCSLEQVLSEAINFTRASGKPAQVIVEPIRLDSDLEIVRTTVNGILDALATESGELVASFEMFNEGFDCGNHKAMMVIVTATK